MTTLRLLGARTEVLLLGMPLVRIDGRLVHLERRQSRAALWMLAASPNGVSRRELLECLWPEETHEAASLLLAPALTDVRRRLPSAELKRRGSVLWLEGVEVDARALEANRGPVAALETAALEAIVRPIRGRFLEGFSIETQAYGAWHRRARARVDLIAAQAFEALVRRRAAKGEGEDALRWARQFVACLPERDEAHRALLGAALLVGRRALAHEYLDRCPPLLRERLLEEPRIETLTRDWLLDSSACAFRLPA